MLLETFYKWNLGMCPEELTGLNMNCHPNHLIGKKAYLAVDATPKRGGIAFFTNTGFNQCFYYQPDFIKLGVAINETRPTEFEMINLLIALFIFKNEILKHKTVRIIVDNNYLRRRGKVQRHALTEAVAGILQYCDDFGCSTNEIFESNTPEDKPFFKVADRLSRNKQLRQWIDGNEESREREHGLAFSSWQCVTGASYNEIPMRIQDLFNAFVYPDLFERVNEILARNNQHMFYIRESFNPTTATERYLTTERYRRMMAYLNNSDFCQWGETAILRRSNRSPTSYEPIHYNTTDTTEWIPPSTSKLSISFWEFLVIIVISIAIATYFVAPNILRS